MRKQLQKVLQDPKNTTLDETLDKLIGLIYDGVPEHEITMIDVKKVPVEGGWLYFIKKKGSSHWPRKGSFVPKIID